VKGSDIAGGGVTYSVSFPPIISNSIVLVNNERRNAQLTEPSANVQSRMTYKDVNT
jgi:hypothetical protein